MAGLDTKHHWRDFAFAPDGESMAVAWEDGVLLLDANTGKTRTILSESGEFFRLIFTQDGQRIIACNTDEIAIWHAASGEYLMSIPRSSVFLGLDPAWSGLALGRAFFEAANWTTGDSEIE